MQLVKKQFFNLMIYIMHCPFGYIIIYIYLFLLVLPMKC
jgi:hypothetical protein